MTMTEGGATEKPFCAKGALQWVQISNFKTRCLLILPTPLRWQTKWFHWLPRMPLVLTPGWISSVTCTRSCIVREKNGIIIPVSDRGQLYCASSLSVCPGSCKALVACQARSDTWLLNGDEVTPLSRTTICKGLCMEDYRNFQITAQQDWTVCCTDPLF